MKQPDRKAGPPPAEGLVKCPTCGSENTNPQHPSWTTQTPNYLIARCQGCKDEWRQDLHWFSPDPNGPILELRCEDGKMRYRYVGEEKIDKLFEG